MKVGLNATLLSARLGGVGRYIEQLIRGLADYPRTWDVDVFVSAGINELTFPQHTMSHFRDFPYFASNPSIRVLKEIRGWRKLQRWGISLFHSPVSYLPLGVNVPSIMTVHDLRYFHFPETYTRRRGKFLEKRIPVSVARAQKIIAVSESTKKDLMRLFGVPPDKVVTIYEGIDTQRFSEASSVDWPETQKTFGIREPYILTVGHLEPRKNYTRLFEAFSILKQRHRIPHQLVIVGQENWNYQTILDSVKKLGLSSDIRMTGFVPDADLQRLYQHADLFVAPSLFEGFGFTPLESMAAGVPVAVSNATSHPEACGDAAVYFDPYDSDDIAGAILRILDDQVLRQSLIEKGTANIRRFQWDQCCKQTFKVYEECLAG